MSENTSPMPDFTTENTSNEIPFINPNINQTRQDSKQEENRPRDFSHQAELIRAAMPYASGTNQQSMNIILKVSELMNTIQNPEPELSACSTDNSNGGFDMEGLLSSLKNVCYQREADIINMLLNTIHARRFYQTYQTVAASMANEPSLSAASLGGNNGRNPNNNARANGGNNMNAILNNPLMKDMLDSFMSPEQRSNFNNITNMINTMSTMNSMNNMNPTNGMNNNMNNNTMNNNSNNMNSGTNNNMNNNINNAMNIMNAMNANSNGSMNNGMNSGMNGGMNNGMNNAMNIMNAMNAMNSMNNPSNFSSAPNMNPVNTMNNDSNPPNNTNSRAPMGNMNTNSSRSSAPPNNGRTSMNRGGMNNRNSMSPPTMNHLHVMELMNSEEDSDQDFLSGDASPDLA